MNSCCSWKNDNSCLRLGLSVGVCLRIWKIQDIILSNKWVQGRGPERKTEENLWTLMVFACPRLYKFSMEERPKFFWVRLTHELKYFGDIEVYWSWIIVFIFFSISFFWPRTRGHSVEITEFNILRPTVNFT